MCSATELAKSSVYAAQWNIEQNNIDNIQVARLSAEEFTQAYNGEREFRRLEEAEIDICELRLRYSICRSATCRY